MIPQPSHRSRLKRQISGRHESKAKFARQEVGNLKEIVLEKAVWSRGLPHDVFCIILACLPLSSFIRLRCVCKKWSIISQDPIFVDNYVRLSSQEATLVLASRDGTYWMYESSLNAWNCISPSFPFFCPKGSEGTWSPVTAVGGRLLLTKNSGRLNDHDYSLMVYNPLSGAHQALPPMLYEYTGRSPSDDLISEIRVVGMFMDHSERYYNILVMDKDGGIIEDNEDAGEDELQQESIVYYTQVYDSRTCKWDLKKLSDEWTTEYESLLSVGLLGHDLRFLSTTRYDSCFPQLAHLVVQKISTRRFEIYGFDSGDSIFDERVPVLPIPPEDSELKVMAAHIFMSRGRSMLAAAVALPTTHSETCAKWKSIIMWESLDVGGNWGKMGDIDLQQLDPSIFQVSWDTLFFLSEGDSLYFGSDTGKFFSIINILTTTWQILPPFPGFVSHQERPAANTWRVLPPFPGFACHRGSFVPHRGRPGADFVTFVYKPGFDLVA